MRSDIEKPLLNQVFDVGVTQYGNLITFTPNRSLRTTTNIRVRTWYRVGKNVSLSFRNLFAPRRTRVFICALDNSIYLEGWEYFPLFAHPLSTGLISYWTNFHQLSTMARWSIYVCMYRWGQADGLDGRLFIVRTSFYIRLHSSPCALLRLKSGRNSF